MLIYYIVNFFAGVFICNCIPHLASGLRGESFPTPFARPPGVGLSSPLVNFLWGTLNAAVGVGLLGFRPIVLRVNLETGSFLIGWLLVGIWLAIHFGKVREKQSRQDT
jgi:hypothetical protein